VHQVIVSGVGASRSGGREAAVPDAEQLSTFFQIVDIGHIELEVPNLGAQCLRMRGAEFRVPNSEGGRVGMGLECNPFYLWGVESGLDAGYEK
jgi:hypothetical protein